MLIDSCCCYLMDVALAVEDAKLVVVVADVSVEDSIDDRLVTPDSLATA